MNNTKIQKSINQFLELTNERKPIGSEQEVCDLQTGECYTIKAKDGIVERINKKFITEDGRQLLQD